MLEIILNRLHIAIFIGLCSQTSRGVLSCSLRIKKEKSWGQFFHIFQQHCSNSKCGHTYKAEQEAKPKYHFINSL